MVNFYPHIQRPGSPVSGWGSTQAASSFSVVSVVFDALQPMSNAAFKATRQGLTAAGMLDVADDKVKSAAQAGLALVTQVATSALKGQAHGFSDYKPNWLELLIMWIFYPSKFSTLRKYLQTSALRQPPALSVESTQEIQIGQSKKVFVLTELVEGEVCSIPVEVDGESKRKLSALYYKAPQETKNVTVVLFHGNAMVGADMTDVARYYLSQGYDVLLPTMGGYPGSDENVVTSEATTYQDVEAIKRFLQKEGVMSAGYHGFSIGGSLAFQAGAGESSADQLKTAFVVADKTFTNSDEVAVNMVRNYLPKALSSLGAAATRLAMKAGGLPKGRHVKLPGGLTVQTDGLDNRAKAQRLAEKNIPLLVLQGGKDNFMGMQQKADSFERNFGDELWEAYSSQSKSQKGELVTVPGWDHLAAVNVNAQNEAIKGLDKFIGLL